MSVVSVKDTRLIIKILLTDLTHTQEMVAREVAARPLGLRPAPRDGEQAQSRGKSQLTLLTLEMAHYRVDRELTPRSTSQNSNLMVVSNYILLLSAGTAVHFYTPSKRSIMKLVCYSKIVV